MIISLENKSLIVSYALQSGAFSLRFEDPSYVRADLVVVDPADRSVGVILHEAYHAIGLLPRSIDLKHLHGLQEAHLSAPLPGGKEFRLKTVLSLPRRKVHG